MCAVRIRSATWLRLILKGLLLAAIATYVVLPVYLYGFTPMGPAVLSLFNKNIARPGLAQSADPTATTFTANDSTEPGQAPLKDLPLTVLLLGYGGPGHDGAYLTDSMVLAIADPKSKSLTLLSIPRDTLVKLPVDPEGGVWSKINTAYVYGIDNNIYARRPERYKGTHGAGNLSKDAVAGVVGLPVRYYVALDFNAFRKFVDEVGGVEVTVPSAFSANYPREGDAPEDSDWMVVRFESGKQTLSGERALQYARARDAIDNPAEGSDFARARRQRQIMQSFRDKVMSPGGILRIPGLLSITKNRVSTDLQIPSMGEIEELLTDWRGTKITEAALTSSNYLSSDASSEKGYYLSPVAGKDDWSQIHTYVRLLINDPSLGEELARTTVIVRNGSGRPEAGKELRDKLLARGFAVGPVETIAPQAATRIEDMTKGEAENLIKFLKSALNDANIPVQTTGFPSLRVAVVLGQDWPGASLASVTPTPTPRP